MSTFAIGDIQGCFDQLLLLLKKIQFDEHQDTLWFTGDLVNRGHQSLETLRFIRNLSEEGRALTVLGNHDLGTLAILHQAEPFDPNEHTFQDIASAHDKDELIFWLEQQPLLHHDAYLDFTLVHAGLHPAWDLLLAMDLAKEVEAVLKDPILKIDFYHHLYGNTPTLWEPHLQGFERLRFIVNCFTRMRFCSQDGRLELETKESVAKAPLGYMPWFKIPNRKNKDLRIIFGHWASILGKTDEPNTFALDTGCVWGNALTAMRLEDQKLFSISCR